MVKLHKSIYQENNRLALSIINVIIFDDETIASYTNTFNSNCTKAVKPGYFVVLNNIA
jgi:hypothetical protein